jgi:S1-C subfamily serine protease
MKNLILPFLLVLPVTAFGQVPLTTAQIAKRVSPSVVVIKGKADSGDVLGSGFMVSKDGKIVTNLHVIKDLKAASIHTVTGKIFDSISVLATDQRRDLAILRVGGFDLPALDLGNSDALAVGEPVVIVGSPRGLNGTVTAGILSAVRDGGEGFKVLQTDAAVNPGNSGGPLVNNKGQAVGVVSFKLRSAEGLNFAIPINYVRELLNSLHEPMTFEQMRRSLRVTPTTSKAPGTTKSKTAANAATSTERQLSVGGFVAQDVESLVKRLMVSGPKPKSEFETAEQYEKRLVLAKDPRQLFFVLPEHPVPNDWLNIFRYDAEAQVMTVDLPVSSDKVYAVEPQFNNFNPVSERWQGRNFYKLDLKQRSVSSRRYLGSNAFGVQKLISYMEYLRFGLTLDEAGLHQTSYSWPISPADAQAVKAFLRVGVLCVQSVPSVYKDEQHDEPTTSDPVELVVNRYYLPVLIQQLWIVDSRSGTIVQKFVDIPTALASQPVLGVKDLDGSVALTVGTLVEYSGERPVFHGVVKNVSGQSLIVDTLMVTVHRKDGSVVQFALDLCGVQWCDFPKDAVRIVSHTFPANSFPAAEFDSVSVEVKSISKE